FVIGNFNTCRLDLPNTATVQADGIPPITSNQVVITIVDGHDAMPQLPAALGSGTGVTPLSEQQLQAAVAQAIGQWRAAGVDAQTLEALERVPVHVASISRGWLGLTSNGEIWIDRTAAGWGWSTDGAAAADRMDLLTVVSHEFGHILGLAPTATGVMEVTLSPGVRQLPEALASAATEGAVAAAPRLAPAAATVGMGGVTLSATGAREIGPVLV